MNRNHAAALAALVMLCAAALPLAAQGRDRGRPGTQTPSVPQEPSTAAPSDFTYSESNGGITITAYTGAGGNVIIPARINGKPVTAIGERAFFGRQNITGVTIPDGVTATGKQAFMNCRSLAAVTIPASVTVIGDQSFRACPALTAVTIPDGVTVIGYMAFSYSGLTAVTIPGSVTALENGAFERCDGLVSVTIGSGVKSIGSNAFNGCTALTSVTFRGAIPPGNFYLNSFPSGLRDAFYAANAAAGTPGTYTRPNRTSMRWTLSFAALFD